MGRPCGPWCELSRRWGRDACAPANELGSRSARRASGVSADSELADHDRAEIKLEQRCGQRRGGSELFEAAAEEIVQALCVPPRFEYGRVRFGFYLELY